MTYAKDKKKVKRDWVLF